MRKINLHILVLIIPAILIAQGGKYAGDFLNQGVGVRSLALGQAYSAAAKDVSAIYYNPAGLSLINSREAYLQYTDLYEGLAYQNFIGYNHPLFSGWSIGAGWMRVGVDDIQKTEISKDNLLNLITDNTPLYDYITGSFSNSNDVFYLSVAKNNAFLMDLGWDFFEMEVETPVGITFKYLNQSIDEFSGSAIGFDLGGMIRFKLNDFLNQTWLGNFTYSFTAKDVAGTSIKWDTENQTQDEIPMHFYHGIEITQPMQFINSEITFLYMYDSIYDGYNNFGFEYAYNEMFAARFGYHDENFTFGGGFRYWLFSLDYAFLPHDLGNSHRISLKVGF